MRFSGVLYPVERPRITLRFGAQGPSPLYSPEKPHRGVDTAPFAGSTGQPVRAPINGKVSLHGLHWAAGNELVIACVLPYPFGALDLNGNYVQFDAHETFHIRFAHLLTAFVASGAQVHAGDKIGLIGQTGAHAAGPHLHMEVRKGPYENGHVVNPMHLFVAAIPGLREQVVVVGGDSKDW